MATYADDPAMPVAPRPCHPDDVDHQPPPDPGLTKREHFAAQILAGLLAYSGEPNTAMPGIAARSAVIYADALIDALNGEPAKVEAKAAPAWNPNGGASAPQDDRVVLVGVRAYWNANREMWRTEDAWVDPVETIGWREI